MRIDDQQSLHRRQLWNDGDMCNGSGAIYFGHAKSLGAHCMPEGLVLGLSTQFNDATEERAWKALRHQSKAMINRCRAKTRQTSWSTYVHFSACFWEVSATEGPNLRAYY